jgi:hypothetical protein
MRNPLTILLVLSLTFQIAFGQKSDPDLKRISLNYFISNHDSVHVIILQVKHPDSSKISIPESDSLIAIFNSKGKVLFTDSIARDGSSDGSMMADTLSFCGGGTMLAYNYEDYSNYGNCTNSIQLLGFNKSGEFVPFTGFIPVCNNTKPAFKWVKSKLKINTDGNEYDCPSEKEILFPYVVVQQETDFRDVSTLAYYKIDFNGLKNPKAYAAEKMEKQPIWVDNLQFKTLEYEENLLSKLSLDLYSKPHLSASKKIVRFKKSNLMKFHYCTQTPSHFWICVGINGVDGFMLFRDLEKLGFEMGN